MHRGYIKLWRKSLDSRHSTGGALLVGAFDILLLKANYKTGYFNTNIEVRPGQFITSQATLMELWQVSRWKVQNILDTLVECGMIEVSTNNRFTLITVCNWLDYQCGDEGHQQQTGQQTNIKTDNKPTSKQTQSKKGKKEEKGKKEKNNTPLTPRGGSESFLKFWKVYPRQLGKVAARKAWQKIPVADQDRVITAAKTFASTPAGKAGKFCPHPATWLNQGRYDDDQAEWQRDGQNLSRVAQATKRPGVTHDPNAKLTIEQKEFFHNVKQ